MSLTVHMTAECGTCCLSWHFSLSLRLMLKFIFYEHGLAQVSAALVSFVAHEEYSLELDVNMLLMEMWS